MTEVARVISTLVWLTAAAILFPGVYRRLTNKARALDDLWTIAFFIVINRIGFQLASYTNSNGLLTWCMFTSIAIGAVYILIVRGYQRNDK